MGFTHPLCARFDREHGDVQTNPHCNNLLELNVQPGILYLVSHLESAVSSKRGEDLPISICCGRALKTDSTWDHRTCFPHGNKISTEPLEPTASFRNLLTSAAGWAKFSSLTANQTTHGWTWSTQTYSCLDNWTWHPFQIMLYQSLSLVYLGEHPLWHYGLFTPG